MFRKGGRGTEKHERMKEGESKLMHSIGDMESIGETERSKEEEKESGQYIRI